ncbi:MAG: hypothetical protein D4R85_02855 [Streptomycetaceae bacterium]|nr:MAG: hypothetical protein D4R85_02855 [Streptomycetaceae bacterium]
MRRSYKVARVGVVLVLALGFITPAQAADNPVKLTAPKEIAVPALPFTGLTLPAFTAPANMVNLEITPTQMFVGDAITITGKGLPGNTPVTLTWSTHDATWVTDVQPNTVNYMGTSYVKYNVVMTTLSTDALGGFVYKTKVPSDFGGIHDIYAVNNNVALAHGGIQVARTLKISPTSGPIGTPITITYDGLGPTLYAAGSAVYYDGKYTGSMQARWTRGTATTTILATGPVGNHFIQANEAISFSYLNQMQSPVPFANSTMGTFKVTKDPGIFKPYLIYPKLMTSTVSQRTTLADIGLDPNTKAVMTLSPDRGIVGSKVMVKVSGIPTTGVHTIVWSTVTGNRVNCTTGTCWIYNPIPLGTVDVTDGTVNKEVTIPDHLGGYHVVQIKLGDVIEAQQVFYVKESIQPLLDSKGKVLTLGVAKADLSGSLEAFARGGQGTPTYTFKEGEEFTLSMKGVGWTQMDNTLAVAYDNSYVGYGCGFNSNGYLVVHLKAMGGVGTHIISMRPLLYTQQPSFANTPYGMVPILSSENDLPGLALGYQIPTVYFAIKIVK